MLSPLPVLNMRDQFWRFPDLISLSLHYNPERRLFPRKLENEKNVTIATEEVGNQRTT